MKKKGVLIVALWLSFFLLFVIESYATQTLPAKRVNHDPVIDGVTADKAWSQAQQITTHDKVAEIDVTLKAVFTDEKIFFLISYSNSPLAKDAKSFGTDGFLLKPCHIEELLDRISLCHKS